MSAVRRYLHHTSDTSRSQAGGDAFQEVLKLERLRQQKGEPLALGVFGVHLPAAYYTDWGRRGANVQLAHGLEWIDLAERKKVGQHEIKRLRTQKSKGPRQVGRQADSVPFLCQHELQRLADLCAILDDQEMRFPHSNILHARPPPNDLLYRQAVGVLSLDIVRLSV